MGYELALEALLQRGRSTLYKDLIDVCSIADNALKTAVNPSVDDITSTLRELGIATKLKTVIIDHTGLPIKAVIITKKKEPNMGILSYIKKNKIDIERNFKTSGAIMSSVDDLYNDKTGVLDKSLSLKSSPIEAILYITAGNYLLKDNEGNFVIKPVDMAALILHELGHLDHQIRYLFRVVKRTTDTSDIIDYLSVNHDKDVILKLIANLRKSKSLDKEWYKILDIIEHSVNSDTFTSSYLETLSALSTIVLSDTASKNLNNFRSLLDSQYAKVKSSSFSRDMERSADDYAIRHGALKGSMSNHLSTRNILESDYNTTHKLMTGENASLVIRLLYTYLYTFKIDSHEVANGYDPLYRRLSLMIETAKHAFQDKDIPADILEQMKQDIKESEAMLADYKNSKSEKRRALLRTWKYNLEKVGNVIASPIADRLFKDYGVLQDATRSLSRNPLYYIAKT